MSLIAIQAEMKVIEKMEGIISKAVKEKYQAPLTMLGHALEVSIAANRPVLVTHFRKRIKEQQEQEKKAIDTLFSFLEKVKEKSNG